MHEQGLFAFFADSGNFIERIVGDRARSSCSMGSNGEAVRFITDALQKIQHRIIRLEPEGFFAGDKETLPSRIAAPAGIFSPLGDTDDGNIRDAKIGHRLHGGIKLPLSAIDEQQIGAHGAIIIRELFEPAR